MSASDRWLDPAGYCGLPVLEVSLRICSVAVEGRSETVTEAFRATAMGY
ncbi:MAG: hypothetical protein ACK58L_16130 [Planctomycetota bacterium]